MSFIVRLVSYYKEVHLVLILILVIVEDERECYH